LAIAQASSTESVEDSTSAEVYVQVTALA